MNTVDIRDLDSEERAAFLEAILESGGDTVARDLLAKIAQSQIEFLNWAKGSSTGTYPITLADGSVIEIPSPKKLIEEASEEADQEDPGDLVALFDRGLL